MNSGNDGKKNSPPPQGWPTKAVIEEFIFKSAATDYLSLTLTSSHFNEIFKQRRFWLEALVRDFGFKLDAVNPLDDISLKKVYIRLARLEECNPTFAEWFKQNIIATDSDFSILYVSPMNESHLDKVNALITQENIFHSYVQALKVSNFELAKKIVAIKNNHPLAFPDMDYLRIMAEHGNASAINWLIKVAGLHPSYETPEEEDDVDFDMDIDSDDAKDEHEYLEADSDDDEEFAQLVAQHNENINKAAKFLSDDDPGFLEELRNAREEKFAEVKFQPEKKTFLSAIHQI